MRLQDHSRIAVELVPLSLNIFLVSVRQNALKVARLHYSLKSVC